MRRSARLDGAVGIALVANKLQSYDEGDMGRISFPDFEKAMRSLNYKFGPQDMQTLFRVFDPDCTAYLVIEVKEKKKEREKKRK